jgi:hypothetical protein
VEQYGYGVELVVEDGAVTMFGHNGHDPGVSALVTHRVHDDTTIIARCNHDRGSWVPTQHLGEVLGLREPRE